MSTAIDTHSWFVSVLRLGRGLTARSAAPKPPEQPLELYDFENCPYCRKVREVFSELDLDYLSRPCFRGSPNRERLRALGGRVMVPFLVDPNAGVRMYESEDIITHLHECYGTGRSGWSRKVSWLNTAGSALASVVWLRGQALGPGIERRPRPEKVLELYNFEASPYCRKVREKLCSLDLDCLVHNVAKKSMHRPNLVARGGKMQVPYLIDPNTGTEMYESEDILAYLDATYSPTLVA